MRAGDQTKKRRVLMAVFATALAGSLLGPAQALAGGTMSATPNPANFGNVAVGSQSPVSITVNNTGSNMIDGDPSLGGTNPSEFFTDSGCGNGTIVSNGNPCTIQVTFAPTSPGMKTATLSIPNDSGTNPLVVNLSGTGVNLSLTLMPAAFDFGTVAPGTQSAPQTFTATSDGDSPVTVGGVSIAGANPDQFQRTGGTCGMPPFGLTPPNSCTVIIAFAPTSSGSKSASLQFTSNAPDSPDTAALTGTAPAPPVITPLVPSPIITVPEDPACAALRAKLKKAKSKRKKRKIRAQLRKLGC